MVFGAEQPASIADESSGAECWSVSQWPSPVAVEACFVDVELRLFESTPGGERPGRIVDGLKYSLSLEVVLNMRPEVPFPRMNSSTSNLNVDAESRVQA